MLCYPFAILIVLCIVIVLGPNMNTVVLIMFKHEQLTGSVCTAT